MGINVVYLYRMVDGEMESCTCEPQSQKDFEKAGWANSQEKALDAAASTKKPVAKSTSAKAAEDK